MCISELLELFLLDKTALGLSRYTLDYYKLSVVKFIRYAGDVPPSALSLLTIKKYIVELQNQNINSVSVRTYSRGLRVFVSWLVENGYCPVELFANFRLPKCEKPVVNVLSLDEQKRLFDCFDLDTILGLRDYLICMLAFGSGLRRGEIVNLRISNVFRDFLIVQGKGAKERVVPITQGVYSLIRRYAVLVRPRDYLLLQKDGSPLTATTVKNLFNRLKVKSDIPRLHPHLLRHTFATLYYENGGDIHNLSDVLGHSSLAMTERYMHMSKLIVLRDFARLSPAANVM